VIQYDADLMRLSKQTWCVSRSRADTSSRCRPDALSGSDRTKRDALSGNRPDAFEESGV